MRIPEEVRQEHVQEAWCRVLSRPGVRQPERYRVRVEHHLAVDYVRRRRRWLPLDDAPLPQVDAAAEVALDLIRVHRALEEAPPGYRELVVRHYLLGEALESLASDAVGERERSASAWWRARDRLYKRRSRAIQWLRRRLLGPQGDG